MTRYILLTLTAILALSCSTKVPRDFTESDQPGILYPDYTGITIPVNIAPLNFRIDQPADGYVTVLRGSDGSGLVFSGQTVSVPLKKWRSFLASNQNGTYSVELYLKNDGRWTRYQTAENHVAPQPIDEYLSYRLIEPGYVLCRYMSINQRNLTNFRQKDIYNVDLTPQDPGVRQKQCINCHAFQNYRTDNMQFHTRAIKPGTIIVTDGKASKHNIQTMGMVSPAVYPAWHPSEKLIAYSVNSTSQVFHSLDPQKVEVHDEQSDLILYDVDARTAQLVTRTNASMETFPSWSPDGKWLYFSSAWFDAPEYARSKAITAAYDQIRYDLIRIPFDPATRTFGPADTVFKASALGKSATFPRVSPDGKYMMYTIGDFGKFHIWHKSSDLQVMDLETGTIDSLPELNSEDVDSYHSWSSNGRWVVFSSRREDGNYTRPYIAYFDEHGQAHKPFILPQKDPDFYRRLFKSFNIPEFTVEPVRISIHDLSDAVRSKPLPAKLGR